jgi:stage II sporulation protein D
MAGFAGLLAPHAAGAEHREYYINLLHSRTLKTVTIVLAAPESRISSNPPSSLTWTGDQIVLRASGSRVVAGESGRAPYPLVTIEGAHILLPPGEKRSNSYLLQIRARDGHLFLIARVPREEYVAAILAGESANFTSMESLKAMAVAARTFSQRFANRHRNEGYDFCDTTHCQAPRFLQITAKLRQAAEATAGELLWHRGTLAQTYYHRDCGGTVDPSSAIWPDTRAPYLTLLRDSYCQSRGRQNWNARLAASDLEQALQESGIRTPPQLRSVAVSSRTPAGRASRLLLTGFNGTSVISASALRTAVGRSLGWHLLRSDFYDVRSQETTLLFQGKGFGHGVGLCQTGAASMGEQGRTYKEILGHYYPGTAVGVSAQGIPWRKLSSTRVDLFTTQPDQDTSVLDLAGRLLEAAERRAGFRLAARPQIKVYPTVAVFRDAVGEGGYVAASTRGSEIRIQPPGTLRTKGVLESTLRHELYHLLIEQSAVPNLPLWFREGLTLHLSASLTTSPTTRLASGVSSDELDRMLRLPASAQELRSAYRTAHHYIARLVAQYGEAAVLRRLRQHQGFREWSACCLR